MSLKTIFIAAPCLIGLTALGAAFTSMQTGQREDSINTAQNHLPSTSSTQPSTTSEASETPLIAAQPLTPTKTSQPQSINPDSQSQSPNPGSTPAKSSPGSKAAKSQAKTQVQVSPPQKKIKPAQSKSAVKPKPAQSALTMQAFDPASANDVPQVPVRVAIARDAQSLKIATSESGVITDSTGKILAKTTPQNSVGVFVKGNGLQFGSFLSQTSIWIRPTTDQGLVFVNGRWYRGLVQLIPNQGRLLAVNHVEMQPYLYSVVGAEMYHSWPAEALKAQAIAARSYALVHIVRPASPHFDLGSTQRWQAYKGVNSEAQATLSAVNDTRGIVISHQGGVVESLYASSAELVQEAHRGFGMSQYGARDLARQKLDYRQILSRFYPGTELSLLQNQ